MARLKPTERRKSRQSTSSADVRVASHERIYENTGFMEETDGNGVNGVNGSTSHGLNGSASHQQHIPAHYEMETARCNSESDSEDIYENADDMDDQKHTSV